MKTHISEYHISRFEDRSEVQIEKTYEQKRWEAALVAMQVLLPYIPNQDNNSYKDLAIEAFEVADAMLEHEQDLIEKES